LIINTIAYVNTQQYIILPKLTVATFCSNNSIYYQRFYRDLDYKIQFIKVFILVFLPFTYWILIIIKLYLCHSS